MEMTISAMFPSIVDPPLLQTFTAFQVKDSQGEKNNRSHYKYDVAHFWLPDRLSDYDFSH